MKETTRKTILSMAVVALVAAIVPGSALAGKKQGGPIVIGPGGEIAGVNVGDWPTRLLQGFLDTPVDETLLSDAVGGYCRAQTGAVVFFPSAGSPDPVNWTCTISSEQAVILTLRDTWSLGLPSDDIDKKTQEQLRKAAKCANTDKKIKVSINDKKVNKKDFLFVGAEGGGDGDETTSANLPIGTVAIALKGHYLAVEDFPPGEHWISIQSEGCSGTGLDDQDVVIDLFVTDD